MKSNEVLTKMFLTMNNLDLGYCPDIHQIGYGNIMQFTMFTTQWGVNDPAWSYNDDMYEPPQAEDYEALRYLEGVNTQSRFLHTLSRLELIEL